MSNSNIKKNSTLPSFLNVLKNFTKTKPNLDDYNYFIYWILFKRYENNNYFKGIIYLNEAINNCLSFASFKNKNIEYYLLSDIERFSFDKNSKNIKNVFHSKKNKIKENCFIQIYINKKIFDFVFDNKENLKRFVNGIIYHFENKENEIKNNNIENNFDEIWRKYDINFDKKLSKNEFHQLAKEFGIKDKELGKEIDKDGNNEYSYEEVVEYLKTFTNGKNYADVFNKFATNTSNEGNKVMNFENLIAFFKEIEKEIINEKDSMKLIIKFKRNINNEEKKTLEKKVDDLKEINQFEFNKIFDSIKNNNNNLIPFMKLREFSNMINSDLLLLYNKEILSTPVDLNRPLCDYLINSTHNTYISGHQLVGKSNVEMYGFAMLEGYRLVELDCYDGKGDEVVITHGYTLVNKLKLDDILKELKNTAFVNNDLPVILSIENHCDKDHQETMAKKCQEILVDIYVFPSDNLPEFLPTLGDLKKKFILKTSGKRVPFENIKNEIKRKPVETLNFVKNKMKLFKMQTKEENKNIKDKQNSEDSNHSNKIKFLFSIQNKTKNIEEEKNEEDENDDDEKIEVINELEKLRGLHGTKFKIKQIDELKYQPWEFVTLKSDKIIKYSKNFETRKQLIQFNQHCLMKAYPQKFDSSNYDIIKCWLTGCQCAAINIQATEDDFTLFDKIFFKQNQNKGYVLKPQKLLPSKNIEFETYEKRCKTIRLKIISVFNMVKLINVSKSKIKKDKQISFEVYSLDAVNLEEKNYFQFKLTGGVIFPQINKDDSDMLFDVFDRDFGCIMIKIKYDEKLIGRGCVPFGFYNVGYRRIPLYDNNCKINQDSFLIGFIQDN